MRILIAIIFASAWISCKTIAFNMKHIVNPKIENSASLTAFVKSYNLDTTNIYVLRDTTAFYGHLKNKTDIPDAFFFNKKGAFINYKKTPQDCNAHISAFLLSIDSISNLNSNSDINLKNFTSDFISLKTHENILIDETGDYELSIIITSAKYLGELNEDKVFQWEGIVNKLRENGHKIRYYKVFFDYMDFWGVDEKDLFKIR